MRLINARPTAACFEGAIGKKRMRTFRVVATLIAYIFASTASAGGGGWSADAGAWSVRSELSSQGRPVCYAQTEPRAGARVTAVRTADTFFLVLRDDEWRIDAPAITVDLQIGKARASSRSALVDGDALVVQWPADANITAALRTDGTLGLTLPDGRSSLWPLGEATAAMAALGACIDAQAMAHGTGEAQRKGGSDPGPLAPATARALADDFQRWLSTILEEVALTVVAPSVEGAPFVLKNGTTLGTIRLLNGSTHAQVLRAGARAAMTACPSAETPVERARHDVDGLVVQHATVRCTVASLTTELVILSFADDPGGLALMFEDNAGDGRAARHAARVTEDLATGAGFPSQYAELHPGG